MLHPKPVVGWHVQETSQLLDVGSQWVSAIERRVGVNLATTCGTRERVGAWSVPRRSACGAARTHRGSQTAPLTLATEEREVPASSNRREAGRNPRIRSSDVNRSTRARPPVSASGP